MRYVVPCRPVPVHHADDLPPPFILVLDQGKVVLVRGAVAHPLTAFGAREHEAGLGRQLGQLSGLGVEVNLTLRCRALPRRELAVHSVLTVILPLLNQILVPDSPQEDGSSSHAALQLLHARLHLSLDLCGQLEIPATLPARRQGGRAFFPPQIGVQFSSLPHVHSETPVLAPAHVRVLIHLKGLRLFCQLIELLGVHLHLLDFLFVDWGPIALGPCRCSATGTHGKLCCLLAWLAR
mmetsp:Transcript_17427/g.38383  ORF Transcript_17427/g.38383 Transcript_17427/m.38383 type:complete len:237 (+) Transcript_17427:866-1576(+)